MRRAQTGPEFIVLFGFLLLVVMAFIVSLQNPNGEFQKHQGHSGGVYSTAFAVICLAVRDQYLPIYQE